jgi:hypothetical protein
MHGAYPNLQLGMGTTLFTDRDEFDDQAKSGELCVSGLYNFTQETLTLPAFGVKLELNLPTGVESAGIDMDLKGLVTKSFDRLSLHLKAGYELLSETRHDEREGLYHVALGASSPVGAPQRTRTTLIGDVGTEQGSRRGGSNVVGVSVGY